MSREKEHKSKFTSSAAKTNAIVPEVTVENSEAEKLCDAAAKGQVLKAKAILEKQPLLITAINSKGQTALHCASREGQFAVVAYLLDFPGVEVNAQNPLNGDTSLHSACFGNHVVVIAALLACGANQKILNKMQLNAYDETSEEKSKQVFHAYNSDGSAALTTLFPQICAVRRVEEIERSSSNSGFGGSNTCSSDMEEPTGALSAVSSKWTRSKKNLTSLTSSKNKADKLSGLSRENYQNKNRPGEPNRGSTGKQSVTFGMQGFNVEEYVSTLFQNFPIEQITERSEELKSKSEEQLIELNNFINTNYLKFLQTAERIDGFGQDLIELKNHFLGLSVILKNLNQIRFPFESMELTAQSHRQLSTLQDIHVILDLPDQLDICTCERQFAKAITIMRRAHEAVKQHPDLEIAMNHVNKDLTMRINVLADILISDLRNVTLKMSEGTTIIRHLHDLGFASRAREVFLEVRKKEIVNEIIHLRDKTIEANENQSTTVIYVQQLCRIVFKGMQECHRDFMIYFGSEANNNSAGSNNNLPSSNTNGAGSGTPSSVPQRVHHHMAGAITNDFLNTTAASSTNAATTNAQPLVKAPSGTALAQSGSGLLNVPADDIHQIIAGLAVWVSEVFQFFCGEFLRQLFDDDSILVDDFGYIVECYNIVLEFAQELEKKGLSMTFLLQREFQKSLTHAVDIHHKRMEETINSQLRAEKWELQNIEIDSKMVSLTDSALYQYQQFMNFVKLIPLIDPGRIGPVIRTLLLLEKYFFELSILVEDAKKKEALKAIKSNANVLAESILIKFIYLCPDSKLYSDQLLSLQSRISVLNEYITSLGS